MCACMCMYHTLSIICMWINCRTPYLQAVTSCNDLNVPITSVSVINPGQSSIFSSTGKISVISFTDKQHNQ
jgi:hypothetical protein